MATGSFPPDTIKEMLGELSIAIDRSTDPANKISLTSSRISKLLGIMKYKCKKELEPGIRGTLYTTIMLMLDDLKNDNRDVVLRERIETLYNQFYHLNVAAIESKKKTLVIESLELLSDYNAMIQCRARWKIASDTYMHNNSAWAVSNKMLADMNDVMTDIEMRYNLVIKPKNMSYSVQDMGLFGNQKEEK